MGLRSPRLTGRAALSIAGIAGLLASVVTALAPAAASSSEFAVTRVPVSSMADSVAADPATGTVYATTVKPAGIAVIDGATDMVTATISTGFVPEVVAVDPSADTVYAIGDTAAAVINGATGTVTATITLPSGLRTISAAVNPVTHMVYVADFAHSTVVVLDGATDTVAATVAVTDPVLAPKPFVRGVAVDTATNEVYASDSGDNQVAVIDGTSGTVTSRITLPAGAAPAGLAVDPSAGQVYVADEGTGAVSVIDAATAAVTATVTGLAQPFGVAVDPGRGRLYVSASEGTVPGGVAELGVTYVIDTASQAVTAQLPRGGISISANTASGSVYVVNGTGGGPLEDSVSVITPSSVSTLSPVIASATEFTFTVGQAGQDQLLASATPAASFSATGLPPGITLSPAGLLSGTPAAGSGGLYLPLVTATNGVAPSGTSELILAVDGPPAVTSASQATFRTGVAGSFTITSSGFPAATITETGALPAGLTLSAAGVLSGTPAFGTVGVRHIELTADNGDGSPATQAFTLTVLPPLPAPPRPPRGPSRPAPPRPRR
jgi:large repetitive protein